MFNMGIAIYNIFIFRKWTTNRIGASSCINTQLNSNLFSELWCICLDLSLVEFYIILSLNPSQFQLSLYLSLSFTSLIIPYSISFSHYLTTKPYSSIFIKFISPISKQWPKTASLILTITLLYLTDALDTTIYMPHCHPSFLNKL